MRFSFHYFHLPQSLESVPSSIKTMLAALSVYSIGWGFVNPVFSIYVNQLVGSYSAYGIIIALMYLACLLGALFVGNLADLVDKKKLVGWTMLTYPFLSMLYFFGAAIGFVGLAFTRVAHGVFSSSVWIGAEAQISEASDHKEALKLFGLFSFTEYASSILGAILLCLAIYFSVIDLTNLGYVFAVLFVTSLLAGFWLKSKGEVGASRIRSQLRKVLSRSAVKQEALDFLSFDKHMWVSLLFAFLAALVLESLGAFVPLFALELKLDLLGVVLLYILFIAPMAFGFLTNRAIHFIGETNAIFFALFGTGLLLCSLFFVQTFSLFFAAVIFLLVSLQAVLKPGITALLHQLCEKTRPGEVAAANYFTRLFGMFCAVFAGGFIAQTFSFQTLFAVYGLLVLVCTGLLYSYKKGIDQRVAKYAY